MIKFFLNNKYRDFMHKALLTILVISLVIVLTIGSFYGGITLIKTHAENKSNWLTHSHGNDFPSNLILF